MCCIPNKDYGSFSESLSNAINLNLNTQGVSMKFDSVLKSNHDLKKNGYQVIRKLHKLEYISGMNRAYKAQIADTYYFVLGCRALVAIIEAEYPNAAVFVAKCNAFLSYLDSAANNKAKLSKSVIAGFLRAYTGFFNEVIAKKMPFRFDEPIVKLWNVDCLMAYIATWGVNK